MKSGEMELLKVSRVVRSLRTRLSSDIENRSGEGGGGYVVVWDGSIQSAVSSEVVKLSRSTVVYFSTRC